MSDDDTSPFHEQTAFVMVYSYRFWDPDRNEMAVSKHMATLDAIKAGLGIPMPETGRKVPRSDVDPYGRHRSAARDRAEG
jgi:hypothetical protein